VVTFLSGDPFNKPFPGFSPLFFFLECPSSISPRGPQRDALTTWRPLTRFVYCGAQTTFFGSSPPTFGVPVLFQEFLTASTKEYTVPPGRAGVFLSLV